MPQPPEEALIMSSTLPQFWRETMRRWMASLPGSGGENLDLMCPMHPLTWSGLGFGVGLGLALG